MQKNKTNTDVTEKFVPINPIPELEDKKLPEFEVGIDGEPISRREQMAKRLEEMRKKNSKLVKGIFRFYEVPNGKLEFVYSEYPGERVQTYRLFDGKIYEIPLGVARHLNKNGSYPVHERKLNDAGEIEEGPSKKVRRFGFQSLDFIDESEFQETEVFAIEYNT